MKRDESKIENADEPLDVALFELMSEPGDPYPNEPTQVYYGRLCTSPTFPPMIGTQDLTYTLSDESASLWSDPLFYFEEGCVVLAIRVNGHWFIQGLIRAPE